MGLTLKILLFTSAIVVALVASTLVFTTFEADRLAGEAVETGLTDTRAFWTTFESDRYAKLRLGLRVLANDPHFKAAVTERHEPTLVDTLRERGTDLAASFVVATDAGGVVLARSDRPGGSGEDLSAEPVVAEALESEGSATVWRRGQDLFHAVSVPMTTGPELVGVLVAGYRIDEALARQIQKLTHADIAFLILGPTGGRTLSVSSLGSREATLTSALPTLPPLVGNADRPFELSLSGDRYAAVEIPLKTASGEAVGALMPMRSLDAEMASHRRFRRSLLLVSLSVMAGALLLAFLAVSRATTPLRKLVALVDRARDGSFTGSVSVDSHDEIGVLARAFNNLLADLREKEQLIGFLRDGLTIERERQTEATGGTGAASSTAGGTHTGDDSPRARIRLRRALSHP